MTSDHPQREAALDPARSFIVEAPAGSGKTSLLVQRYLRLLSTVERPEAVVAMTFTRKAAAEMRERVLKAFEDCENGELIDEHQCKTQELARAVLQVDRQLNWNLRVDTSRLQIQTIDSLCATLTRQMPVVSHLGGAPNVVENATELYRIAARRTIRGLAEGDAEERALFQRIALHFENDLGTLEMQVASMLERREQWRFLSASLESSRSHAQDFCDLLGFAEQELRNVFRNKGEVDFTEITRAAINALGGPEAPSDLLYSLDYRIQHLLVDEFQDTSLAQYELLEALTGQWSEGDNRTLFVVGDPMQSIYRFRQAEVGLFLQCWHREQLGSVRLHCLQLTSNFRSTPEIVKWAQDVFSAVMTDDNPAEGSVKFRNASAARPETDIEPKLIAFIDDKGNEEAREVARLCAESLEKGDVAILVRSRAHLASILPVLREAGIRYEAFEIDQLREEQHILDLISLTRAIVHLGDRVSWLACLRAPWCGLDLSDLSALAEHERDRTILDLLSDPDKIAALSVSGRIRAVRTAEILSRAVNHLGRCPLRELVEQSWLGLGGPSLLREPSHLEDALTYFELVEQFEEGGVIRDFSLLNARLEFLFAKPLTGVDCVKIMTIHSAKGLEFDTVILPNLGGGARINDRDLIIWSEELTEGGRRVQVACQPRRRAKDDLYDDIRKKQDIKEAHEVKRLFYVAATRAKNRLYLLGSTKTKDQGANPATPRDNTFLKLVWTTYQSEFEAAVRRRKWHQPSLFEASAVRMNILHRLPETWKTPKLDISVSWEPELRRSTASARTVAYEWVSDTGRHVGTVVHEVLKRIARTGVANWQSGHAAAAPSLIKSELLRLGVPRGEESRATAQVLRAVANTLGSEKGRWMLEPHAEAQSEWTVGGRIGEKLIAGTVDRTFRDGDGRLWIVDYKTSEHEGADLSDFLAEEERRYRPQLESYAVLLSRFLAGPISLGLY
ncbi:MAG: helicase/exodeoxyribonuclease subunit, partial [Bryobacterales bacterium]|nr:helicase/exodeoxyribonuclease subunit [Bryobacterales bacterium]